MLTILTIAALFALAIWLGYKAGADTHDRAEWARKAAERQQVAAQYAAAMADSRQRHPSAR
jgi:hypothetical protein